MIDDHWFRTDDYGTPCAYQGCGELVEDHVEAVGEWMDPRHWFTPFPGGCGRCGRHWRHSTHWVISPKNRSLWIRPRVREGFFRTKDRIMRRRTCCHFSHRLRLPCWRESDSCSGLCEIHYDDCRDGCL